MPPVVDLLDSSPAPSQVDLGALKIGAPMLW